MVSVMDPTLLQKNYQLKIYIIISYSWQWINYHSLSNPLKPHSTSQESGSAAEMLHSRGKITRSLLFLHFQNQGDWFWRMNSSQAYWNIRRDFFFYFSHPRVSKKETTLVLVAREEIYPHGIGSKFCDKMPFNLKLN